MKAYLIYNPAAGPWHASQRRLDEALAAFAGRGWGVTLCTAQGPEDVTAWARAAYEAGCDAAIVAGGDGSLRQAADALAGTPVALGVLPCGTANVWAQELGLPLPRLGGGWLAEAARLLTESGIRAIDLGRANGRHFLLWAGVGLDAYVAARVNPSWLKRAFGVPGYALAALITALCFRGIQARLKLKQATVAGQMLLVVVSNVQLYAGGVIRLDERARLDDGLLEAWAFQGHALRHALAHLWHVWTGRHWGAPGIWHGRIQRMVIEADPPALVHLDGEPLLRTPVEIEVVPGGLRALVPPRAAARLFTSPAA